MKERVPHMCITCQHYEPYHCTRDDHYIGYLHCDELTKCSGWRLHENYKKGGKWYNDRPEKKQSLTALDVPGLYCDDITFCWKPCSITRCPRNQINIRDRNIQHSYTEETPDDCPKKGKTE